MKPAASARKRRVVKVVDNRPLAKEVGGRLRKLRMAAGMTQRELAEPRYTSAYVSALENGLAKPSMAALHYLAGRLGVTIGDFLPARSTGASLLEADLRLASGDAAGAAERYRDLLEGQASDRERAEIQCRLAEASCRLRQGRPAIAAAAEAVALFRRLRRDADAAQASYWLAYGHHLADNSGEARVILQQVLGEVREGLDVLPDFMFRLLVALANVESWDGHHERALAYLEEARSLVADLDGWRRATLLLNLSRTYRAMGDDEASFRVGSQALASFQDQAAKREVASLENSLALTLLQLGHVARAREFARHAHEHADELSDASLLSNVLETEAQVELADGELAAALDRLATATDVATTAHNREVIAAAHHTRARVLAAQGDPAGAIAEYERAASTYRELELPGRLRPVLSEWAERLNAEGKTAEALDLYREALSLSAAP